MTEEVQGKASQQQPPAAPPAQQTPQVQQPAPAPAQAQFNPDEFFSRRVQAYVDQSVNQARTDLQARIDALGKQQPVAPAQPEVQPAAQEPATQQPAVQQPAVQPQPPQPGAAPRQPEDFMALDIIVDLAGMPDDAPEIKAIQEKSKEVRGRELVDFAREQAGAYLTRTAGEVQPKAEPEARIGLATGAGIPVGNNPIAEVVDHNELYRLHKEQESKGQ